MDEVALQTTLRFKTTHCITCGVVIALPGVFYDRRLKDQKTFYCPSGHPQHFCGETEEQRLKKELARAQDARDIAKREAEIAEAARLRAEKQFKKVERERKKEHERTANGVCPCCTRSFVNLQRHIATKHPDYAKETAT